MNTVAKSAWVLVFSAAMSCGRARPSDEPANAEATRPSQHRTADSVARRLQVPTTRLVADTERVVADKVVEQLLRALAYPQLRPILEHYQRESQPAPIGSDAGAAARIVSYSESGNTLVYLQNGKSPATSVLMRGQISAHLPHLAAHIYLGMSKSALAQVVAHPFSADVLLVSEEEGYQKFYFSFQHGKLHELNFQSDYID